MKRVFLLLLPAGVLLSLAGVGRADVIFAATINAAQEVPTNSSTATGFATFVLNDAMTALTYSATIFGIDFTGLQTPGTADNLVAMHIHASPTAFPGVNAGVVFGFLNPNNDINPPDRVITPFAVGVGGTVSGKWDLLEGNNTTLAAQLPNILAGNSYINFHTTAFPGGEIRGQIQQTNLPEPTALALALLGGAGVVGMRLIRRRRAG